MKLITEAIFKQFHEQLHSHGSETCLQHFAGLQDDEKMHICQINLGNNVSWRVPIVPYHINLNGIDLSGIAMRFAQMSWAQLEMTNFSRSDLGHTQFRFSTFNGANLAWVNLTGASITQTNFCMVNLTGANLKDTRFQDSNVNGACFIGVQGFLETHKVAQEGAITTPEALVNAVRTHKIDYATGYGFAVSVLEYAETLTHRGEKTRCIEAATECIRLISKLTPYYQPDAYKRDKADLEKTKLLLCASSCDEGSLPYQSKDVVAHQIAPHLLKNHSNLWHVKILLEQEEAKGASKQCVIL